MHISGEDNYVCINSEIDILRLLQYVDMLSSKKKNNGN